MKTMLFVYGTLVKGLSRNEALEDSKYLGIAHCKAELKDCGAFPAMVEGNRTVIGEVYEIESERILASIDQIEGYIEGKESESLYVRREINVRLFSNGDWITAQTYLMIQDTSRLPTIECGDYRRYFWDEKGSHVYYLAFGSNLSTSRLRERIDPWQKSVKGYLPGYRLVYNKRSHEKEGIGYANIITGIEGEDCPCVAYFVGVWDIASLDHWEGESFHYIRTVLPVRTEDGEDLMGFVYLALPDQLISDGKPSQEYRDFLLQGYKDHGLGNLEDYECDDTV